MKRIIAATLALTLLGGTAAMAQPVHTDRNRQHASQVNSRHDNGHAFTGRNDARGHDMNRRNFDRRDMRGQNFRRGDRFAVNRGYYNVVPDWERYRLRRPPYGYEWVRDGNDFLLVAITSGIIADILLNQY